MLTWTSPTIPYNITPLDRGSGLVPTIATGIPDPSGVFQKQLRDLNLLKYTYMKASLVGLSGTPLLSAN